MSSIGLIDPYRDRHGALVVCVDISSGDMETGNYSHAYFDRETEEWIALIVIKGGASMLACPIDDVHFYRDTVIV